MLAVGGQVVEQVGSKRIAGGGVYWVIGWAGEWMCVATRRVSRRTIWGIDFSCDGWANMRGVWAAWCDDDGGVDWYESVFRYTLVHS